MINHPVAENTAKKPRSFTDFVTPQVVIPALLGSVVLFAWMMGIIG
jgi:hypothetical protein